MDDATCMKRALRLARRGEGYVEPNPMVGCVIVQSGRVVGEGWHRRFGGAHAEVEALRQAGAKARGATVYVTLEPCDHEGKTPPCAKALIAAGVKRVVAACIDPNRVSTGGVKRLRAAGIDVEVGLCEPQGRDLIAPFTKRTTTGLPYVIAKWAQTLDGAIATHTGDSQWISGPESRRLVHRWRGRVDAVMVGIGTASADDPQLTARDAPARRVARRVIVDPSLRLPEPCRLLDTLDQAPLTVATTAAAIRQARAKASRLRERGVELFELKGRCDRDGLLGLEPLMRHLASEHDVTNVLAEGGAGLTAALFRQGLADEAAIFLAGRLLVDGGGLPPLRLPKSARHTPAISDGIPLHIRKLRRIGPDVLIRAGLG